MNNKLILIILASIFLIVFYYYDDIFGKKETLVKESFEDTTVIEKELISEKNLEKKRKNEQIKQFANFLNNGGLKKDYQRPEFNGHSYKIKKKALNNLSDKSSIQEDFRRKLEQEHGESSEVLPWHLCCNSVSSLISSNFTWSSNT